MGVFVRALVLLALLAGRRTVRGSARRCRGGARCGVGGVRRLLAWAWLRRGRR